MIRTITDSDIAGVVSLATVCGLFEPDQTSLLENMMRSRGENDVWFTDDGGNELVGVAYLAPEKMTNGTWNLYWIAVHPDQQRRGRGRAILNHVINWLSERGARLLLVETSGTADFEYVRSFYSKQGFKQEARIHDFYDADVDKIVFTKLIGKQLH